MRSVDWKNLEYRLGIGNDDDAWVRVRNGVWSEDRAGLYILKIANVVFGDLTGDGVEEAVIDRSEVTGGSGDFTHADVIMLVDGRPIVVQNLADGDRCVNGIDHIRIARGRLLVCIWDNPSTTQCDHTRLQTWSWNPIEKQMELIAEERSQCTRPR